MNVESIVKTLSVSVENEALTSFGIRTSQSCDKNGVALCRNCLGLDVRKYIHPSFVNIIIRQFSVLVSQQRDIPNLILCISVSTVAGEQTEAR